MTTLKDDNVKLEVFRLYSEEGESISDIARLSGIPRKTLSDFLNKSTWLDWWESIAAKPFAAGTTTPPEMRRKELSGKRFVMTSAQNNTFVFKAFFESLQHYCSKKDATLLVGTFTYNKSGFQNLQKEDGEWYDPLIEPYIYDHPTLINSKVLWCGELNILPTAVNPLSGLTSYTKELSGFIPHVKVRLESCPRPKNSEPKFLYTTGAITKANYIQKKEGQKGEFHHTYAAIVLEFDEQGDWYARHIIADKDGCFYDLDEYYSPDGVEYGLETVEALQYGDLHSEKPDEDVYNGSFGDKENSILDTLQPKYQFCHDSLNMTVRGHHNIKDMFFRLRSQVETSDKVEDDLKKVVNVFEAMDRDWCKTVVVESNHDLALMKWLNTADIRFDNIDNVLYYHKCQVKIIEAIKNSVKDFSIFKSCILDINPQLNITFLKEDDSFVICQDKGGIECANHGHLGINGSRGSAQAFTRIGLRQNVGHFHSPCIVDGVYAAGISGNLDQGYNKGSTSWSHSHILTYKNGKRTIITMRGNKWRA